MKNTELLERFYELKKNGGEVLKIKLVKVDQATTGYIANLPLHSRFKK